jgi:hypothetical protein
MGLKNGLTMGSQWLSNRRRNMANLADLADEFLMANQEERIKAIREAAQKRELTPNGECRYCGEPVVIVGALFCHPSESDCRDLYASEQRYKGSVKVV